MKPFSKTLLRYFAATFLALILALPCARARAETVVVAAGAGYKKMVDALAKSYEARTGNTVDRAYGNMARTLAQAKAGGVVDLVIGADWFLKRSDIAFSDVRPLGKGRLVLVWAKSAHFASAEDLLAPEVKRIALPNTERAIYGRAAMQYLKNTGLYDKIKDKLLMVATVPQVSSYLLTGEVDMGFVNSTHVLAIKDKVGGYAMADEGKYEPIAIMAASTPDAPHPEALAHFLNFLASDAAKAIITANGI
ncbi:molybdate ABC transporter substrate-binding protein [Desulfocurvus sp. DL9XJH121]